MKASEYKLSRSARILAARRDLAFRRRDKLGKDRYAHLFVDPESLDFAKKTANKIHYVLMRHQILEDLAMNSRPHFKKVVLLGAGLDTKFLRFPNRSILEVDNQDVISYKHSILEKNGLPKPASIALTINSADDLRCVLRDFDIGDSSIVIAEGFFMYLDDSVVYDIFDLCFERKLALGFDMISPSYLEEEGNRDVLERLKKNGENVLTLINSQKIDHFFQSRGWNTEIFTPTRLQQHYYKSHWSNKDDKYVAFCYDCHINFNF